MTKNQLAVLRYARNHVLDIHDLASPNVAMRLVDLGLLERRGKKRTWRSETFQTCTFVITNSGMVQLRKAYPKTTTRYEFGNEEFSRVRLREPY